MNCSRYLLRVCLAAGIASTLSNSVAESCAVTEAPVAQFVPPAPYAPVAPKNRMYVGDAALWTELPTDGTWQHLPVNSDGFHQKIFWFSQDFSWRAEPQPSILVSGRRLDLPGKVTEILVTHAILRGQSSAMIAGVVIPSAGCWQFSGTYRGHTRQFVVKVVDK